MEKSYRASTGVDEFYYAKLTEANIAESVPERVRFLQNISVEMGQEPVRAYGDNKVAEIAVAAGDITVNSAFHKLPEEDKAVLLGLEEVDGILAHGSSDTPPYVAVVFAKTYEDGSTEWVGLTKGLFLRPNTTGASKQGNVEFNAEEISAAFMDREVEGFSDDKAVLFAKDKKGETTNRDKLFNLVFGKSHPNSLPEGA
ncbi:major tail protein [Alkalihalophilus marmarensis]|uniref:major tail protein n=1 Tax=Alkalihalophilus marmarensis TaxID=521377 RepID=UPI002E20D15A|nr:major tail protein [Alkalihalophilus marmarensis]MED1603650.1 phage tail protein [Alkalihalophilus marmarensis]